jgi:uncharacterized protein YjbI with pentapeptide repeats
MSPVTALGALVLDDGEAVGIRVEGARQPGVSFARARLVDVQLVRCDLSGCDFSSSAWERVELVDCRLSAVELPQASLRHVTFTDCRLDDANVRLAQLRDVRFASCDLRGAELQGAQLERVAFAGTDLTRADVSGVRCRDVDLRDARLDALEGASALAGATIEPGQLVGLAPALARALGIVVAVRDEVSQQGGAQT